MPRTWVVLTNEDLRTLSDSARESGLELREELQRLVVQALRRKRKRRATADAEETDAA